jgi:tRNA pseudouridine55 synthase
MFGVFNINKSAGLTSRDVVNRVQRRVRPDKAGHAGTLDPLATGVLLVCVGPATRLVEHAQRLRKSYRGTFLLGQRSDTDDVEHEVEIVAGAPRPTRAEIDAALPRFVGEISQRPPRHSAVKIAGRRAYELARAGVEFEPDARTVVIHCINVVRYEYPELVLEVDCGSGAYIRSLGRDLAESLRTCAVMSALERTAIGDFRVDDAMTLADLDGDWQGGLLPAARLVAELRSIVVTATELRELQHGRTIDAGGRVAAGERTADEEIAAFDDAGNLVALLRWKAEGVLVPSRNFTQAD